MQFHTPTTGQPGGSLALPWQDFHHSARYLYPERYQQKDIYKPTSSYILPSGGYLNTENDTGGIAGLMDQRREVIEKRASLVIYDIEKRRTILDKNLERICLDQCTWRNLIYELGEPGMLYLDKRRLDIERQILDLEKEKRMEEAAYFRDTMFLKKELREAFIENLEETQKATLFMNEPEETPWKI